MKKNHANEPAYRLKLYFHELLHFISSQKPWSYWKPLNSTPWAREYFEALKDTPWEDFIYEYNKKAKLWFFLRLFYPSGIFRTILQKIFSIKNSADRKYKIITVLGIKFIKEIF